ncbi:universal stress protein [Agromyces larvae]|uniref:Universal stress protein n=1 Tax=Agromyces larvae TaxID=2929802 RepID=A0ABY4BWX1_9MICO|nr:universal stress protein [Agromyces larvae]UOE43259.1 universal stress protein [Agromyces larvae]
MPETFPTIVVGVTPHQPDAVVQHAAALAGALGARLVCATVDPGHYVVEEHPDGSVRSLEVDPDAGDLERSGDREAADLVERLHALLDPTGLRWEHRGLAGDPTRALAHLADTLDAAMIVVGTREPGVRGTLREFFSGSVAAHLAHRQHRPVLVVPLAPVGFDDVAPWDSAS